MTQVERRIIEERNTTAIIRERDFEMVKKWDQDTAVRKTEAASSNRANAVGLALSVINGNPNNYSLQLLKEDSGTPVDSAKDFWDDEVQPLSNIIYGYLTQGEGTTDE